MSSHDVVRGGVLLLIGCTILVQSRLELKMRERRRKAVGTGLFGNGLLVAGITHLMQAKVINVGSAEQSGLEIISALLMVSGLVLLVVETAKEQNHRKARAKQKLNSIHSTSVLTSAVDKNAASHILEQQ